MMIKENSAATETQGFIVRNHKQLHIAVIGVTWKADSTTNTISPKNYVNVLSFSASVFSGQNLPAVIIICILLFAVIIGITVIGVKRKKKKSALAAANNNI